MTSLEQTDQDDCEPARLSPVDTLPAAQSERRLPAREETWAGPGTPSSCSSVSLWVVLHTHTKKTTGIKTLPSQPAQKRRTQFPGGARCALLCEASHGAAFTATVFGSL